MCGAGDVRRERASQPATSTSNLANKLRRKWLASGVARVDLVPELDLGLSEPPTQQHGAASHLAREIHQSQSAILELDAKILELALVAVELTCQSKRLTLELFAALPGRVNARRRCYEVELENRLAPAAMLLDDILDDFPDQRER